jgi:glycerol-3-phosphate cytidylyltransferase
MKKYQVGYTTGVFDMFHIGHLNILRRAKEQCEFLIVGVSTDDVVKGYKNKIPIVPFEERILIVDSIKYVDKTVPQTSMDKYAAWENLKYDVIFHGDDLKGTEKWNEYERQFAAAGVDIVYLPYTLGTSSTQLREVLDKIMLNETSD